MCFRKRNCDVFRGWQCAYAVIRVQATLVAEETVCTMYAEIGWEKLGKCSSAFGLKKQIDDSLLLLPCSNAWKSCRCFYSRTRTCSAFLWYAYINETSVKCPLICSRKFHASFVSGTLLGIFLDRSLCSFRCVDRCFFAAWKEFLEQWRFYSTAKDNSFQFWHS